MDSTTSLQKMKLKKNRKLLQDMFRTGTANWSSKNRHCIRQKTFIENTENKNLWMQNHSHSNLIKFVTTKKDATAIITCHTVSKSKQKKYVINGHFTDRRSSRFIDQVHRVEQAAQLITALVSMIKDLVLTEWNGSTRLTEKLWLSHRNKLLRFQLSSTESSTGNDRFYWKRSYRKKDFPTTRTQMDSSS